MTSHVEVIDDQTVRLERLLPGPIERVWAYITEAEKRAKWLAGGEFELTIGGPIKLEFHNASLSPEPDDPPPPHHSDLPERMYFDGAVTRCEPPTLLAHTWNEGNHATEVEYRLEDQGNVVLVTLTHRRLKDAAQMVDVMGGWHTHFDIFADVLEGRIPRPFWKTHTALENEYKNRL